MISKQIYWIIAFVVLGALSSCSASKTSPPWGIDTFYIIEDVDQPSNKDIGKVIEQRVKDEVLSEFSATTYFKMLSKEEVVGDYNASDHAIGFVIQGKGVPDMGVLSDIQKIIIDVSQKEKVPVELNVGYMRFQSVGAKPDSYITMSGSISEGADLAIDDGSGKKIDVEVLEGGSWACEVKQNDKLAARNGMIYAKVVKGNAVQFMEINVLSKKERNIAEEDLPMDSVFRKEIGKR